MAANNNDARKKQTITGAVDDNGDSSLPTTTVVVIPPALSFRTILKEFPDFLFCVLRYIADRVVFNSIASSNRDIYTKSKAILPPWPILYKLPRYSGLWSWSPCGTRIACSVRYTDIEIFDQRRGPLRRWRPTPDDDCHITGLKFSPDRRYLVSVGDDCFIRLWDNVVGNYEQLQEWNMAEEAGEELIGVPSFCISACSKCIAVSRGHRVFLKDVEKRGSTIKSLMLPFVSENNIYKTVFSSNGPAIIICCTGNIQVWRPYLDDDNENRLITLWRETVSNRGFRETAFSNDNTMLAIHNEYRDKGTLWYIDMDHNRLTHESKFPTGIVQRLHFTADGKYIVFSNNNGPTFWSITEGTLTNNTMYILDIGNNTKHNLHVECFSFSPNNRQCILHESSDRYITSYFVK